MMKEAAFIHSFFGQIKKQKTKTLSKMLPGLKRVQKMSLSQNYRPGRRTHPEGITADGL